MSALEVIGYLGSILVAVSLTMNNLLRLRWINLAGAGTFALYGFLIKAYPVMVLNSFITAIDAFYLIRMYRQKEYFDLLWIKYAASPFLSRFLEFYDSDIRRFFSDYQRPKDAEKSMIVFVMRNLRPAGLFIGQIEGTTCRVTLDYVTPEFRDSKGGHYLWSERQSLFQEKGIKQILSSPFCPQHEAYLKKVGFSEITQDGMKVYEKRIERN
ncbi:MAG: hypothetical protein CSA81_11600 [Acidobacteria bacterium]|nr:MAG: hypothetical protein CSA81_11600 [Acidobacteriota bacterium]PIE91110.1 MAG: hypothetical protein CR997_03030 [Acidobacteriota bacterium]